MIVAAAQRARAARIVTEDLNHGQQIEGIFVENPFLDYDRRFCLYDGRREQEIQIISSCLGSNPRPIVSKC